MQILIAEDDLVSRRLLKATLIKWGYDVIACADGTIAWEHFQRGDAPKLMILDWMMPGLDGVELCRKIRKLEGRDYHYIILLTAKAQREDIIEGMEAGADDYITKPFNKSELQVRLRAGRRILDLQELLLKTQEKLRVLATHDPLTGLFNRRAIEEHLESELDRSVREKAPLSLIMLDLDHFKNINDKYGHIAGDFVLREIASRMNQAIRKYDIVGRFGGEEFLLLLPGCDQDEVLELAERIRTNICETEMDTSEGMISVSASLGATTLKGDQAIDAVEFISASDTALYMAKENGRNRVEIMNPESQTTKSPPAIS